MRDRWRWPCPDPERSPVPNRYWGKERFLRPWYDTGFCGPSSIILSMGEAALMDRQILRAKLYVPRYRADAVPSSRLHERLDEGARRDFTVVSAPAGFGKTTLLADWSQRSELPVAWVSLDERDDDPARFLLYLIAAIGTIHEGFGTTTRAFLGSLES